MANNKQNTTTSQQNSNKISISIKKRELWKFCGDNGSQIDLLIVRKDQVINLCEMKYSEAEYMADVAFDRAQRRKLSDFQKVTKTKCAIHLTLVTTYGIEETAYSGEIQSVVTSEDLFR